MLGGKCMFEKVFEHLGCVTGWFLTNIVLINGIAIALWIILLASHYSMIEALLILIFSTRYNKNSQNRMTAQ